MIRDVQNVQADTPSDELWEHLAVGVSTAEKFDDLYLYFCENVWIGIDLENLEVLKKSKILEIY